MKGLSERFGIIRAIIARDLLEFSRDRLWMVLTPVSLLFAVLIFRLMAGFGSSAVTIGIQPESAAERLQSLLGEDAVDVLQIQAFNSREQLQDAVFRSGGDLAAGLSLNGGFTGDLIPGEGSSISIFFPGSLQPLLQRAIRSGVREAASAMYSLSLGRDPLGALPVKLEETGSLFRNMNTEPFSLSDQIRPILVLMVLLVESLALAGLVSMEIGSRTAEALLVTPAGPGDLILAKFVTGMLLAVTQGFLFLMASGYFGPHWILISLLMILGAGMSSAVGMISGAGGRDFIGTMFFGMLFLIPLMIPAISFLVPGRPPLLVRLIPSYSLVESLRGTLALGTGWGYAIPRMIPVALWDIVLLTAALVFLRRRVLSA